MQHSSTLKYQNRSLRVDIIRIFALLGAVGIHFVFPVYTRPDFLGGFSWWLAAAVSAFGRMSIPLFIMLSGFLVLPKSETYPATVLRTVRRLLIPLAAWFVFSAWWDGYYLTKPHELTDLISMVAVSNMFHLYFLVILAGLYLAKPLLRLIALHEDVVFKKQATVGLLFFGFLIYLAQYFMSPSQSLLSSFTIWLPYAGYFVFGVTARFFKVSSRLTATVVISGLLFTLGLSYMSISQLGAGNTVLWGGSGVAYFDHFLSPVALLMSISFFHLLLFGMKKHTYIQQWLAHPKLRFAVTFIAQATFGMYLSHIVVLNIVDMRFGYALEFLQGSLVSYIVGRFSLALALSFVAAVLLRKLPVMRYFVGE